MNTHNRAPLEPGEGARLETLNTKILAALQVSAKTNKELSDIALDYGRRIRDLRADGHRIDRERLEGGLNLYTLNLVPEPKWVVEVNVTLADGTQSLQTIIVAGDNEGLVRNRAQHMATRVKIVTSQRIP